MKKYTLGFIFNESLDQVLLIHKLRPDWQAGKLNGVGGKMEQGEDHFDCIVREVREESSLAINKNAWVYLGDMGADSWQVHVFASIYKGLLSDAKTSEGADAEKVEWFPVHTLPSHTINNLSWLIPLAIDKIKYRPTA
ncbi:MAG: NUDIX domain-containing protein [Candidatus Sungbacteria bacterium]|nr:NUDIX domain-containing protein [Candidatus Sungbacteria bacterium]